MDRRGYHDRVFPGRGMARPLPVVHHGGALRCRASQRGMVARQSQAPDQPTVRACLLARISPASALEGYGLVHAL